MTIIVENVEIIKFRFGRRIIRSS